MTEEECKNLIHLTQLTVVMGIGQRGHPVEPNAHEIEQDYAIIQNQKQMENHVKIIPWKCDRVLIILTVMVRYFSLSSLGSSKSEIILFTLTRKTHSLVFRVVIFFRTCWVATFAVGSNIKYAPSI